MSGAPAISPSSQRTRFTAGRDLKPGAYVRPISSGAGEVIDSEDFLLVTDQKDRKGNVLLVNTSSGAGVYALPSSIWSTSN